jgi:hypothetical protein
MLDGFCPNPGAPVSKPDTGRCWSPPRTTDARGDHNTSWEISRRPLGTLFADRIWQGRSTTLCTKG